MSGSSGDHIKDVNIRYHDIAAGDYDRKWGISYASPGRAVVVAKLEKALGRRLVRFGSALEIGAGTGYFTLNLLRAGVVREAVATDISQGMLDELERSARGLGVAVATARCEAAALPFEDESFDLVLGHAVLHHIPDLDAAFAEFRRVLRPGGLIAFCGEPSRHGDRVAAVPKRVALALAPAWRRVVGARPRRALAAAEDVAEHGLEHVVDVHAFTPSQLSALAGRAGFDQVRVRGEELVAGLFGWANRTLESTADADSVPFLWQRYAYRGYLTLKALDDAVLERRLPPALCYNLLLSARKEPAIASTGASRTPPARRAARTAPPAVALAAAQRSSRPS